MSADSDNSQIGDALRNSAVSAAEPSNTENFISFLIEDANSQVNGFTFNDFYDQFMNTNGEASFHVNDEEYSLFNANSAIYSDVQRLLSETSESAKNELTTTLQDGFIFTVLSAYPPESYNNLVRSYEKYIDEAKQSGLNIQNEFNRLISIIGLTDKNDPINDIEDRIRKLEENLSVFSTSVSKLTSQTERQLQSQQSKLARQQKTIDTMNTETIPFIRGLEESNQELLEQLQKESNEQFLAISDRIDKHSIDTNTLLAKIRQTETQTQHIRDTLNRTAATVGERLNQVLETQPVLQTRLESLEQTVTEIRGLTNTGERLLQASSNISPDLITSIRNSIVSAIPQIPPNLQRDLARYDQRIADIQSSITDLASIEQVNNLSTQLVQYQTAMQNAQTALTRIPSIQQDIERLNSELQDLRNIIPASDFSRQLIQLNGRLNLVTGTINQVSEDIMNDQRFDDIEARMNLLYNLLTQLRDSTSSNISNQTQEEFREQLQQVQTAIRELQNTAAFVNIPVTLQSQLEEVGISLVRMETSLDGISRRTQDIESMLPNRSDYNNIDTGMERPHFQRLTDLTNTKSNTLVNRNEVLNLLRESYSNLNTFESRINAFEQNINTITPDISKHRTEVDKIKRDINDHKRAIENLQHTLAERMSVDDKITVTDLDVFSAILRGMNSKDTTVSDSKKQILSNIAKGVIDQLSVSTPVISSMRQSILQDISEQMNNNLTTITNGSTEMINNLHDILNSEFTRSYATIAELTRRVDEIQNRPKTAASDFALSTLLELIEDPKKHGKIDIQSLSEIASTASSTMRDLNEINKIASEWSASNRNVEYQGNILSAGEVKNLTELGSEIQRNMRNRAQDQTQQRIAEDTRQDQIDEASSSLQANTEKNKTEVHIQQQTRGLQTDEAVASHKENISKSEANTSKNQTETSIDEETRPLQIKEAKSMIKSNISSAKLNRERYKKDLIDALSPVNDEVRKMKSELEILNLKIEKNDKDIELENAEKKRLIEHLKKEKELKEAVANAATASNLQYARNQQAYAAATYGAMNPGGAYGYYPPPMRSYGPRPRRRQYFSRAMEPIEKFRKNRKNVSIKNNNSRKRTAPNRGAKKQKL